MRGVKRIVVGQLYASAPPDRKGCRPLPAVIGRCAGLREDPVTHEVEAQLEGLRTEDGRPWAGGSQFFNARALEFVH